MQFYLFVRITDDSITSDKQWVLDSFINNMYWSFMALDSLQNLVLGIFGWYVYPLLKYYQQPSTELINSSTDDSMGLFDFFNREKPPSDPKDRLKQRWLYLSDGLIKDNNSEKVNHYVARFSTNVFETWFLGLEQRLGQSLGRRLAHAALEHQEYFLNNSSATSPSNRDLKSWSYNRLEWQTRGLGRYSKLDDEEEVRLLIEHPASRPDMLRLTDFSMGKGN